MSEYIPDWELMSSQALVRLSAVCVPARFFTEIGQACGCLIRSSANDLGSRYADRQHVERAHAKIEGRALRCRFAAWDFLVAPVPEGPFQFVFDRGCFHVFDEPGERQRFAAQIAAALVPGGLWLSLMGSTESPPREVGPTRRSAREITHAIEPALEIVELRSAEFRGNLAKAWFCLSRQRPHEGSIPFPGTIYPIYFQWFCEKRRSLSRHLGYRIGYSAHPVYFQ
ncbi:MAG TPA: class I SAM-dependent methyltransferase [Silvibacterium sp.]|nr:class I SAM-dependent methyltransferase [Silvibacterium sp.]